jgi:probable HAF family extracellular repeat protein
MHGSYILLTAAATLLALGPRHASAQPMFREFLEYTLVQDMSADGSVIVGFYDSPTDTTAFRWTASGGIELIGVPRMFSDVRIARDGKTIIGTVPDSRGCATAAVWQGGTTWKLLDSFPGVVPSETNMCSNATAVSGDGSVIVGAASVSRTKVVAFRWDATNGMRNLGTFDDGDNSVSRPYAVSADGRTIVGWDYKEGFRPPGAAGVAMNGRRGAIWWDGKQRLVHAFGWAGEAWATNHEGSIIVGQFHPIDQFNNLSGASTYKYTAWDGHFEDLGAVFVPIGGDQRNYISQPFAMSDDGSVIVGEAGWLEKRAMIWTQTTGMVYMSDFLTGIGVNDHVGWTLLKAHYVSPDGRTIAGFGQRPGGGPSIRSWILTLRR